MDDSQSRIRNFAIIAHIDHGKSTLADRLLEMTGTVEHADKQTLDSNPIEQERGITIKLAPVRMLYHFERVSSRFREKSQPDQTPNLDLISDGDLSRAYQGARDGTYILNLIDTPGHVDFSYEVSRALAACEGAILLVDATQGIQAQTMAHYREAKKLGLKMIPVINKIDLISADIETATLQLIDTFGFSEEEILKVSAKTGEGVEELLEKIIAIIPPPCSVERIHESALRALVFNSQYDPHQGVVAWVRVVDGMLREGEQVRLVGTNTTATALEVGYFEINSKLKTQSAKLQLKSQNLKGVESETRKVNPQILKQVQDDNITRNSQLEICNCLSTGEVGYVVTGLKDPRLIQVGDTVTLKNYPKDSLTPLPGYHPPKPMIFASFYPLDQAEFVILADALDKLKLLDSSLTYVPESSPLLGNGFRVGFLGLLHAEIVQERLEREFGLSVFASAPNVMYRIKKRGTIPLTPPNPLFQKEGELPLFEREREGVSSSSEDYIEIHSPQELPDLSQYESILEPMLAVTVFNPSDYTGPLMTLFQEHRATMAGMHYSGNQVQMEYRLPLAELVSDFYSQFKSVSSGYASLDYQVTDWQEADLVKLDIMLAGEMVPALSRIVPKEQVQVIGKHMVDRLVEVVPRHNFEIAVQAAVGAKILARGNIKPFRKDVTAKLYGGDQTRKDKLLKKQKKGKKKMKQLGKVSLPPDTFWKLLK